MNSDETKKYTAKMIAEILKNYSKLKRQALQLEFEINCSHEVISSDDVIEAMTFNHANGSDNIKGGQISDKTANIAVSYIDRKSNLIIKHKQELEYELDRIHADLTRLEYYISLLDENKSKLLTELYIKGSTYTTAMETFKMPLTTLRRIRRQAINDLVDMFNFVLK